jgi:hypothetical protein
VVKMRTFPITVNWAPAVQSVTRGEFEALNNKYISMRSFDSGCSYRDTHEISFVLFRKQEF